MIISALNRNYYTPPPLPPIVTTGSPTIGNFTVENAQPTRVYFNSSEIITASTDSDGYDGFTISGKSISEITIQSGLTTGHFFTVTAAFTFWMQAITIRYEGGSDMQDLDSNSLFDFRLEDVINNLTEPLASVNKYVNISAQGNGSGSSEANASTFANALTNGVANETWWMKAGDYGTASFATGASGNATNPIKFKGYVTTIGDLDDVTYYSYGGGSLNSADAPLLDGTVSWGIRINHSYLIFKNIQIENHQRGINISGQQNIVLDNIVTKDMVNGWCFLIELTSTENIKVSNCLAINGDRNNFRLDGNFNLLENCLSYCDNAADPTDYYTVFDGDDNVIRDCYIERVGNLSHTGHGYTLKTALSATCENNLIKDSACKNIKGGVEFRHAGVQNNVARNITFTKGLGESGGVRFRDGASFNIAENCTMTDLPEGMRFYDQSEEGAQSSDDNKMINCVFDGCFTNIATAVGSITTVSTNKRNEFINCTFRDSTNMFSVNQYQLFDNTNKIINSIIDNVTTKDAQANQNDTVFENCDFWQSWTTSEGTNSINEDPSYSTFPTPTNTALNAGLIVTDVDYDINDVERSKLTSTGEKLTIGAVEIDK